MATGKGERATGTPNTIYDLSSVLFHALEGGASYDTYIEDAEQEGDQELAGFFRRVRDEDSVRADDAWLLLARRTSTSARTEGATSGSSPRPEPSRAFPGTEPIVEESTTARTGEMPPPPEEVPPERAGEIPTAEEVPPPRAEEVPGAEEVPPRDVLGETTSVTRTPEENLTPPEEAVPPDVPSPPDVPKTERVPPRRTEQVSAPSRTPGIEEEALPKTEEVSPRAEEAPPPEEQRRAREQEDRRLVDEVLDRGTGPRAEGSREEEEPVEKTEGEPSG